MFNFLFSHPQSGWFAVSVASSLNCLKALNEERPSCDDLSKENLGIGLLSHTRICSIMGDEELDCRVRNGIGYTLFSMDTKEI